MIGGSGGGYPVDILEEDMVGGHTFARHIGKPDEYLRARIFGSRTNIAGIITTGKKRAGSFTSLEAANKLVNSVLAENRDKIDAFVAIKFPFILPVLYLNADLARPTGYEAYAPDDRAYPQMRTTYGVTIRLIRTAVSKKGYHVHSAWPTNRD